jgi:multisubunit Na+/H+ antiporter MnhE subunit
MRSKCVVTRLWRHRLTAFVIVFLFAVWGLVAHGDPQTLVGGWIVGAVAVFLLLRGEVRKRREEEARQYPAHTRGGIRRDPGTLAG